MPLFRKKPVIISAEQFLPPHQIPEGVQGWQSGREYDVDRRTNDPAATDYYTVATLEGPMQASPFDWIITGVKGEKYPCKPDIFAMTYEPAE